jgi:peptidyl-prolyl cis-trans isomerase SurA
MKTLTAAIALLVSSALSAQTLFTYGKESVSVNDFLRAYKRNNTGINDEASFKNYLDLYVASRLKIKEAKTKRYDTLPQMVSDLEALRQQVAPSYLVDKATIDRLTNEAFNRSQKDIRLAHIFISTQQDTPAQLEEAKKKLAEVSAELKKGTPFGTVAEKYSDDPGAKINGGSIGWITVFDLPYELENLAYNTPAGQVSQPYQSKAGFHLLKPIEERKAMGRVKAAQVLVAFPPAANEEDKKNAKRIADSLYTLIQKGSDFGDIASRFSNDVVSAASRGAMMEFGVGEYSSQFEDALFALKPGELSKPFATSYGYHIVKLLERVAVNTDKNDSKAMTLLKDRVMQSDRIELVKKDIAKRVLERYPKQPVVDIKQLGAYTDSLLDAKKTNIATQITGTTTLLQLGAKKYTANDWLSYAMVNRLKTDGTTIKPYSQVWEEFKLAKAIENYISNLEKYNEEFRLQMQDFSDGNLFFEIMQRQVWTPAQMDTVALQKYFDKNKNKYNWGQSVDAITFYTGNQQTANEFISELKKDPANWQELVKKQNDKAAESQVEMSVSADSARFEMNQVPNLTKDNFKAGTITPLFVNPADNTVSFAYIVKIYTTPEPRNFIQAKPLVVNDYQEELEKKWVTELKKKYPVTINQNAWNELLKSRKWN